MTGYMRDLGNGKFQFEVSAGRDGKGKRNKAYKTVTIKASTPEATQKKAEKQLAIFVGEVEKGENQKPSHYTFSQYVDKWRENAVRDCAPMTYHRYSEFLRLYIIPQIGGHKLEDISPIILEDLYNELRKPMKRKYVRKDGTKTEKEYVLCERTILHIHRLISSVLQTAFRKDIIKENPIARTDAPKVKKKEAKAYDNEQIAVLIEALEDTGIQFKTMIHIALAGGLRVGEVCGLEWSDVDYDNSTLTIRQASQYISGQGIFVKDPKNETSKRMISMPAPVMDMITQLEHIQKIRKVELGNKWEGGNIRDKEEKTSTGEKKKPNLISTQADGSPMYPHRPSKLWKTFVEKNGLPKLTFHGLRHTSASYLIACGQDVASVAKRLGHSNSNTTLSIYAHAFKKRDEEAARHMEDLYAKKEKKDSKIK
ncbi:MAG: site-specific integrase [Atribacterota bacterium]|nr:site-specific integrase [Atribacterota bacterium]